MKMKKVIFIMVMVVMTIVLMGAMRISEDDNHACIVRVNGEEKEKIICVVYDNSSSMFKDDPDGDYTDRWVQAEYAMKAFALMMNEGDTLQPYIMGDYKSDEGTTTRTSSIVIRSDSNATLADLEEKMGNMKFTEWTYFPAVNAAVSNLQEQKVNSKNNKDCWIIVLTDGFFQYPSSKNPEEIVKIDSEGLKKNFEVITNENEGISIAYVPIGKDVAVLEEDRNKRIYTIDGNSIMEQITQVINLIYGRVQLNESIKERYIQQNGNTDKLIVNIDIPVEKLIVFLQDRGETGKYVDLEENLSETLNKKITNKEPTITDAFSNISEVSFTGREEIPDKEKNVTNYVRDLIQYSILRGLIYKVNGNKQSMNMSNQYVSIEADSDAYDTVDVYYQPAISIGIDYFQNGEKVEHGEGCNFHSNSDEYERCIREGELTVRLYLTDSKGEAISHPDSDLLYADNFEVMLQRPDGTVFTSQSLGNYNYQFTPEEGEYTLSIRTPWNALYEKKIEVQEPVRPLTLECINTNIWIDQRDSDGSVLSIQVEEGGEVINSSIAQKTDVVCETQDKDFTITPLGYQGEGIWKFRILLADYEQHQIAESIQCNVTATRHYDSGTAKQVEESKSDTFLLDIVSGDFELSIKAESEVLSHYCARLFWGEDLSLSYFCDGKELTTKQIKDGLTVTDFRVEPASMQKYFKVDRNNHLQLKNGLFWLFPKSNEIEVAMNVEYERYNTLGHISYYHVFSIRYIPVIIRICIYSIFCVVAIWIILCLLKRFSKFYVKRFKADLASRRGGVRSKVVLKRGKHILVPLCKTANLVFKESRGVGEPSVRSFNMKIMRNSSGEGWKIVNYEDFSDSKRYRIGGLPITQDNRIFWGKKYFSVRDNRGREKILTLYDE